MNKGATYRLILLGERRICWEVLQLLYSSELRGSFDLRVLVSDSATRDLHAGLGVDLPVFIPNDARRNHEILAAIDQQAVNLLLSVQHNWILSGEILRAVNGLAFNLHNARLPDYKGYNSISHAILNGDGVYQSTVHWMAKEVDAGDIAFVGETEIRSDDTARSLYLRTIPVAADACKRLLFALANGDQIPRHPTEQGAGQFFDKDSVRRHANVSGISDLSQQALIARATFFPPSNIAYFDEGGTRYYLVPESGLKELTRQWHPVNRATNEGRTHERRGQDDKE